MPECARMLAIRDAMYFFVPTFARLKVHGMPLGVSEFKHPRLQLGTTLDGVCVSSQQR